VHCRILLINEQSLDPISSHWLAYIVEGHSAMLGRGQLLVAASATRAAGHHHKSHKTHDTAVLAKIKDGWLAGRVGRDLDRKQSQS
jgi:hypothetical protein